MQSTHNLPTTLVIFGATGDLARKKLIPSLYHLFKQDKLPEVFTVIAFARSPYTAASYTAESEKDIKTAYKLTYEEKTWQKFAKVFKYVQGDAQQKKSFEDLANALNDVDNKTGICTHKVFYLSVTPDLFEQIFDGIKHTQMNEICRNQKDSRVIIEKPFGNSLSNFRKLNALVGSMFNEEQVYHIDHLLGKETVQNLIYFRAANPAIMSGMQPENIESMRINYYETIGVGLRGKYYDNFGQLRDMVQSHLFQLAALTLMDLPEKFDAVSLSSAKTEFLLSLQIRDPQNDVIRAQYQEGIIDGNKVAAYRGEPDVDPKSNTETFVKINATVKSGPWQGLPITFATGKRLTKKLAQVIINYKTSNKVDGIVGHNQLIFNIQPEEGITLKFQVKVPTTDDLETADLKFKYQDAFQSMLPEAYEKILFDIITRTDAFDITGEELEACWELVDPILESWKENDDLKFYPAGSNELL